MISTLVKTIGATLDIPTLAGKLTDHFFPDLAKDEKQRRAAELEIVLAQIRVNEESAKHPSLFVAGARPFSIWLSNILIAIYALAILISWFWFPLLLIPEQVTNVFWGLVMAWGGLHGIRSFDKLKGTARSSL